MSNNNLQNFLEKLVLALKPLAEKLEQLNHDAEVEKFILGILFYVNNFEKTDPIIKRCLLEMQSNPNFSEAIETMSYKDIYKHILNDGAIGADSITEILSKEFFQKGVLEYFDKINLTDKFSKRKILIEDAFKLYRLGVFSGCLCLLHSQLEGIMTDYLVFKRILKQENDTKGKTVYRNATCDKKVTGLFDKIDLAKNRPLS